MRKQEIYRRLKRNGYSLTGKPEEYCDVTDRRDKMVALVGNPAPQFLRRWLHSSGIVLLYPRWDGAAELEKVLVKEKIPYRTIVTPEPAKHTPAYLIPNLEEKARTV